MKIPKKVLIAVGCLLVLAILAAPLALVLYMSEAGMQTKQLPDPPRLLETTVGDERPIRALLQNVQEAVVVSGTFVGSESAYQELAYKEPGAIRWIVSTGQEVHAGQTLGYYKDEEVVAQYTGVLKERNTYASKAYLRYELFSPVELQCSLTPEEAEKLRTAEKIFTEQEDLNIQLTYISNTRNADGTVNVRFILPESDCTYGQTVQNFKIYTGQELKFQMVLPVSCIYQKVAGEDQPWYVYQVTMEGEPIGEIEVELGYTDGEIVCINQLEMATYYRRVK